MASVFTRIAQGDLPGYFVAEDDDFIAILDINPIAMGHTLVIPRVEIDYIFDLDNDLLSKYLPFAGRVAKAIEKCVPCARIGMAVVGLEVPHAHLHLIPINGVHDIDFSRPKLKLSTEEMASLARKIRSAFI
ncbi:MAG: HIT family protein [Salibacteraceae bacterium]